MSEKEVFVQEVSDEEMEAVAGGEGESNSACSDDWSRSIYYPSFPNCAATVEDGSWCGSNDACTEAAVKYWDTVECVKAWK